MAEIIGERGDETVLVVEDEAGSALEPILPDGGRDGQFGREGSPLAR